MSDAKDKHTVTDDELGEVDFVKITKGCDLIGEGLEIARNASKYAALTVEEIDGRRPESPGYTSEPLVSEWRPPRQNPTEAEWKAAGLGAVKEGYELIRQSLPPMTSTTADEDARDGIPETVRKAISKFCVP